MSEQLELMEAAPDAALTPEAGDNSPAENTDATGGTENVADNESDGQQDGQANKDVIETEKQKSEKKISGIQKRLNELTRDKYAERQAREQLERQNLQLMEMLKGGQKPAEKPTDGKPNQSDYSDYAEFVRADATWHATQAAKQMIASERAAMAETTQRSTAAQSEAVAAADYAKRAKETAKSVPDFDEVMAEADVDVPQHVLTMIRRLDNGPLVAYHMVKNPELAQQFFAQPPMMHGILLGQLSATLKGSAKVSNAPPPGKTVKSQAGSSSEPPEDADAYMAWAAKNMR